MFTSRGSRIRAGSCVLIVCVLASAALAGAASRAGGARSTPTCTVADTQVWLGLGVGGGAAGSVTYPLELSNVGRHACMLTGYPAVWAVRGGARLGPVASHANRHPATVRLTPGATAHAMLKIVDAGAVCGRGVEAVALLVRPPGQPRAQEIPFEFTACAHRGVLVVGEVRGGTGIPGYTLR